MKRILTFLVGAIWAQAALANAPWAPVLCDDSPASCAGLVDAARAVKWHPGHYMQLLRNGLNQKQSNRFNEYDLIANNDNFVGVFTPWRWSQLEGATQGDYSTGIQRVKEDIAYLKSLNSPKRFILKIVDFDYANVENQPKQSLSFPYYLRQQNLVYQGKNAVGWCRWNETAMGYYIDMLKAYAAEFDDEPYFEGIILYKETAPTRGGGSPCGYSHEAYYNQTVRMVKEVAEAFPKTNVLLAHNYLGNQTWSDRLVEQLAAARAGISGPDVLPTSCAHGNAGLNGTWGYRSLRGDDSGVDYRGVIPSIWSVENSEMGSSLGYCTPDQLGEFASDSLHASHIGWDRNTFTGDSTTQWPAVKAYVSDPANALKHTSCPAVYTQGCNSN
jgi:hypothetical protein